MTQTITLSNDRGIALVDDSDFEMLSKYKWHIHHVSNNTYARTWVSAKRREYMHRMILPNAELIDHINRNGLDNRRENIRECTKTENSLNSRLRNDSQSGHKGVYPHKASGKWVAYGHVPGRGFCLYLGLYPTMDAAILAQASHHR